MVEKIYRKVGRNIRAMRELRGMPQGKLAAKVKLTRTSIVNIEAGRQRVLLHTIITIAKVLRVQPQSLLGLPTTRW